MKLKEMKNTVVNVKTQEEYDELMGIYQKAGWKKCNGMHPEDHNIFYIDEENTCIEVSNSFRSSKRYFFICNLFRIISFEEFKKLQGISEKDENGMYKTFTKDMLEVGMVVEQRDGQKFMIMSFNNELFLINSKEWNKLSYYKEDLTNDTYKKFDIVKVFKAIEAYHLLESNWSRMKLIWERKENKIIEIQGYKIVLDNETKTALKEALAEG